MRPVRDWTLLAGQGLAQGDIVQGDALKADLATQFRRVDLVKQACGFAAVELQFHPSSGFCRGRREAGIKDSSLCHENLQPGAITRNAPLGRQPAVSGFTEQRGISGLDSVRPLGKPGKEYQFTFRVRHYEKPLAIGCRVEPGVCHTGVYRPGVDGLVIKQYNPPGQWG